MVVKLIEIAEAYDMAAPRKYMLREVFINPEHVIYLRPDELAKRKLTENKFPDALDKRQEFTCLKLNSGHSGLTITVVGSPSSIEEKLRTSKQLLRG
jgi:hypothetical protein